MSDQVVHSLLHQLNDALCVHKEDFSLRLLVQSSSMAVQDVGNLGGKRKEKKDNMRL